MEFAFISKRKRKTTFHCLPYTHVYSHSPGGAYIKVIVQYICKTLTWPLSFVFRCCITKEREITFYGLPYKSYIGQEEGLACIYSHSNLKVLTVASMQEGTTGGIDIMLQFSPTPKDKMYGLDCGRLLHAHL